jgi:hypothetical protein
MMRFQGPPRAEALNHTPIHQVNNLLAELIDGKELARIIHETRGRRSRIPEKQGLMGLVKSGARALFSRQGSVLASSIDRKVA